MIQRIQTIWLLLASAFVFALLLFPYFQYATAEGLAQVLKVNGVFGQVEGQVTLIEETWLLLICTIIIALLPLYTVLKFKNRKQQLLLTQINMIAVLGLIGWLYYNGASAMESMGKTWQVANLGVGFFLLPIVIVFLFLARAGIKKDEKLIRSVDRLR
jgi:hypothetical protein